MKLMTLVCVQGCHSANPKSESQKGYQSSSLAVQVLMLTEQMKAKPEDAQDSLAQVEKYISEAYKIIDKSAKVRIEVSIGSKRT